MLRRCLHVIILLLKLNPNGSEVKILPANAGAWVRSLGLEDRLEKEMAIHSSILDWNTPWTEELGGLQSIELHRVRHDSIHTHWSGSTGRYEERQKL